MAGGHGEFAFDSQNLQAIRRTHDVPKSGLARSGCYAYSRGPSINIVGNVRGLRVPCQ